MLIRLPSDILFSLREINGLKRPRVAGSSSSKPMISDKNRAAKAACPYENTKPVQNRGPRHLSVLKIALDFVVDFDSLFLARAAPRKPVKMISKTVGSTPIQLADKRNRPISLAGKMTRNNKKNFIFHLIILNWKRTAALFCLCRLQKEGKLPFFQRVVKLSHSLSGLRVGAHEFQHSLRSDARPS